MNGRYGGYNRCIVARRVCAWPITPKAEATS